MENNLKMSQIDYRYSNVADFCKDLATKTTTDIKNNNVLITYYFNGLFGLDKIKTYANTNVYFITSIDNILIEFQVKTFDEFKKAVEFYQQKALELKKELEEDERKKANNVNTVECKTNVNNTNNEHKCECKCGGNCKCMENKKFSNEFLIKKLFLNLLETNKDYFKLSDDEYKKVYDKINNSKELLKTLERMNNYCLKTVIREMFPPQISKDFENIFSLFDNLIHIF